MHAISINLKPSKIFNCAVLFLSIGSLLITLILNLAGWIKFILIIMLILYSCHIFWRYGLLKSSKSILKIIWHEGWFAQTRDEIFPINILGETTITRFFCVLCYSRKETRKFQSCLITRDILDKDDYRKLLSRLKNCR